MTKEEILESRKRVIHIGEMSVVIGFDSHFEKYKFIGSKVDTIGQYFLYERFISGQSFDELHYPKLGLYLNSLPCDQTIEVEWVNIRRTWEQNLEYDSGNWKFYMFESPTEIEREQLWSNELLVYGVWDTKPNWKQLRQAYERTWWFYRTTDEIRNIQLDRILK